MRILILTDSLGCPREEIGVSDTWTDRIIKKHSGHGVYFYTQCKRGLKVLDIDVNSIKDLCPDLIIMQIGIVDAVRRALSERELHIISCIPIIRSIVARICRIFHYEITKIRNVHYTKKEMLYKTIAEIKDINPGKVVFIAIAPPGNKLISDIYNVNNDIDTVNDTIKSMQGIVYLNPYPSTGNVEEYLLSDGHHLNFCGEEMVFNAVDKAIENLLKGENNV